jgi:hypothetical protein
LKRVLAAEPGLDDATRERLTETLQSAIALVSQRYSVTPARPSEQDGAVVAESASAQVEVEMTEVVETIAPDDESFDPYSPNVIVVFRTRGRDAALAELHSIENVDCLRLLAREQQLGIASDLDDPSAIRQAIVAAAERRVANRRAAAS